MLFRTIVVIVNEVSFPFIPGIWVFMIACVYFYNIKTLNLISKCTISKILKKRQNWPLPDRIFGRVVFVWPLSYFGFLFTDAINTTNLLPIYYPQLGTSVGQHSNLDKKLIISILTTTLESTYYSKVQLTD